jgi:hypothetical protein
MRSNELNTVRCTDLGLLEGILGKEGDKRIKADFIDFTEFGQSPMAKYTLTLLLIYSPSHPERLF